MSFPRYPKYKDSGVEWLGKMPEDWRVVRLRFLLRDGSDGLKIGPFGSQLTSEMLDERGGYKVYGQENVIAANFERGSRFIGAAKFTELSVYDIQPGDLLVTMMGTSGRCAMAPAGLARGILDSHLLRLRLNAIARADLVRLLIDEAPYVAQQIRLMGKGSIMHGLNSSIVKELRLLVPPTREQEDIVSFVSLEAGKIDALIAEQQRLIELLTEKRRAVISHAVTKGINPDVSMKPSGVDWLGDVPGHWTLTAVRRVIARIEQGWSPECFSRSAEPTEWGVLKAGCVNRGVFDEDENKALPDSLEPIPGYEVRAGDVLMSRASGSPDLVGSTAYVSTVRPRLMLSDKIFRIRLEQTMDREFFVLLFNSRIMRYQIERAISGADGLANNLPQSALLGFLAPLPPIEEQREIVARVSTSRGVFEALTAEAERAIALLQERRTTLISAAVTGKIDVRDLNHADATAA